MEDKDLDFVLPVEREDIKTKEKIPRKFILICVIGLLIAFGITVALSYLLPKTVQGSWELVENPEVVQATADQIDDADRVYYVFEKPNQYGQGNWKTIYSSGIEHYEYELLIVDGVEKINLGADDLDYKIKGSKLLGIATMTITLPQQTDTEGNVIAEEQQYVFKQKKAPDYSKDSYDDYNVDSNLIGSWATNERTLAYYVYSLSYKQTVEFVDNGIMVLHYESEDLALDRYMYYAYTADNNVLTFSLVTDRDIQYSVKYDFDENGNLKFTEDTTADSIFADAFFADFTYYTPENLPELAETQTTIE